MNQNRQNALLKRNLGEVLYEGLIKNITHYRYLETS
jgi:hypothetical protein